MTDHDRPSGATTPHPDTANRVILSEPHVARALMHAFPAAGEDAYQPLLLEAGSFGLRLLGIHSSQALIGQLEVTPSGLVRAPESTRRIGVLWNRLRGALEVVTNQAYKGMNVEVALGIGDALDLRIRIGQATQVRRTLANTRPGLEVLPRLVPFDGHPQAEGLRPTLLSEAISSMADLPDLDTVRLSLNEEGVHLEPDSPLIPASFQESVQGIGGAASSHLLKTLVREVAMFGSPAHGTGCDSVAIALVNNGLMRFRYTFEHGNMTYWVTPVITE